MNPPPSPNPLLEVLQRAVGERYEIVRRLGEGGMGTVFLARETAGLGRQLAIKVLALRYATHPEFRERFRREAETIAGFRHQYVVPVIDFAQREGLSYFVMSFIPGPTLASVIEFEKQLPIEVAAGWIYQVASALAYAHERGVLHRDVKPSNILLDEAGKAVLTDFGIAQDAENKDLTGTGMIVGSPWYLSPERWRSDRATAASDQYALGVVAYELLSGRHPFAASSREMADAHLGEEPNSLETIRSDCPRALVSAVHRMLAKRPVDRFPSLEAVTDAIGEGYARASAGGRREMANRVPRRAPAVSVRLTGVSAPLPAGEKRRLQAGLLDATGAFLPEGGFRWTTSDPTVAVVTPEGVVEGLRPGKTEVTAWAEGHSDTVELVVGPPMTESREPEEALHPGAEPPAVAAGRSLGSRTATLVVIVMIGIMLLAGARFWFAAPIGLRILDAPGGMSVGQEVTVRAVAVDRAGRPINDATFVWRSLTPELAAVVDGRIEARSPGEARVEVSFGGLRAGHVFLIAPLLGSLVVQIAVRGALPRGFSPVLRVGEQRIGPVTGDTVLEVEFLEAGTHPLELDDLPRTCEVNLPGSISVAGGTPSATLSIEIACRTAEPAPSASASEQATGTLSIILTNGVAEIFVDGVSRGRGSILVVPDLRAGRHVIEAFRENWQRFRAEVEVTSSDTIRVPVTMVREEQQ